MIADRLTGRTVYACRGRWRKIRQQDNPGAQHLSGIPPAATISSVPDGNPALNASESRQFQSTLANHGFLKSPENEGSAVSTSSVLAV